MTHLTDQLKTEKVGKYLWYVIDDGGNAEEGRCATVILKMPEEESEDQADAEAHKPSYEEERSTLQVLELFQHGHPFWDRSPASFGQTFLSERTEELFTKKTSFGAVLSKFCSRCQKQHQKQNVGI